MIKIQGNANFQGKTILGTATPTYAIGRSLSAVNEGSSVVFTLSTTNVANGTVLPYTISGISANDVTSGSLTGSFTVSNNLATATITLSADQLTEGAETATLTLNNIAASNFVVVNDTSIFTPATISGLQLWLDAADSSTLFDATAGGSLVTTDGAVVARWSDKSGNNRHVAQATANARPLLKTAVKNGRNIIRFDGLNDVLTRSLIPLPSPVGSTGFYVMQRTTGSVGDFLTPFDIANLQRILLSTTGANVSNGINFIGWPDSSTSLITPTQGYAMNTNVYFIASLSYNGGTASNKNNYSLKINKSVVNINQNGGTSDMGRLSSISIGARANSTQFVGCDVAEVILYNSVLSLSNVQIIEEYLSSKWAI